MTEELYSVVPGISPARVARKEAQSLTAELASLIKGVSGLDSEGKLERLQTALAKSQEVTAALTRALET
jgi:hypothetical protein